MLKNILLNVNECIVDHVFKSKQSVSTTVASLTDDFDQVHWDLCQFQLQHQKILRKYELCMNKNDVLKKSDVDKTMKDVMKNESSSLKSEDDSTSNSSDNDSSDNSSGNDSASNSSDDDSVSITSSDDFTDYTSEVDSISITLSNDSTDYTSDIYSTSYTLNNNSSDITSDNDPIYMILQIDSIHTIWQWKLRDIFSKDQSMNAISTEMILKMNNIMFENYNFEERISKINLSENSSVWYSDN